MRVLVIDGNAVSMAATVLTLKSEGITADFTDLGEEGVSLAKLYDFDAITLDLQLPDMTGFEALRQIRRANIKAPVLILSTMAKVDDIVKALSMGADDYLTKPCDNRELVARIQSLVRRSKGLAQSVITTGNVALNLATKTVTVDEEQIYLTGKEYAILELLSLRKGVTLAKDVFMGHLYGGRDEPELKIVDVFICKLRKKMNAVNAHPIETIWGRGYVLRDADTKAGVASMASEVRDLADDPPTGFVADLPLGGPDAFKSKSERKPVSRGVRVLIPAT